MYLYLGINMFYFVSEEREFVTREESYKHKIRESLNVNLKRIKHVMRDAVY